ncbi:MAG TPA: YihY/virulence factor BrkB family protein [Lachnospiraceae bacterium]|nr:YihY/virulence factor BrkB family protein [Lachnospiraceae bacterium]
MNLESMSDTARKISHKIADDYIPVFSAQAAFFIIISFFPFLMFLLTLINFLPFTESQLLTLISDVLPVGIRSYVISIVTEIFNQPVGTIISITALTALWSSSRAFLAIVRGLNTIYDIDETRNYILLRITSTLYTFVFALIIIASLGLLVFGNRLYLLIATNFPLINDFALAVIGFRTIVSLAVFTIFFLILYTVIPNRKTRVLNELPGAILASAGWMLFSFLYSIYIDNVARFSSMYGSLTAIVLLMLWLYFCMYILFIGAEVNVLLLRFKPLFKRKNS